MVRFLRHVLVLGCLVVLAAGCASTPFTGLAVQQALKDARAAGWQEVGGKWIPPGVKIPDPPQVAGGVERIQANLDYAAELKEFVALHGRDEWRVALQFRPWAIRLGQVGDGLLISGAAAGAVWLTTEALDSGGDPKEVRTTYNVVADRGSVVQIGNRDGNTGSGKHDLLHEETVIPSHGGP